jgi:hypothetical protein
MSDGNPLAGFAIVYAGHHHEVWCNGTIHHWTFGGSVKWERGQMRAGACDCAKWKSEPTVEA